MRVSQGWFGGDANGWEWLRLGHLPNRLQDKKKPVAPVVNRLLAGPPHNKNF